jgi:hypothetical protein
MKPGPVTVRADVDVISRGVFERWELDQIPQAARGDV